MRLWIACLLALACSSKPPTTTPTVAHREILWDTWGIPHIYGRDEADVAFGMGRAQMQSHGDLLLKLYGQARGRAAEYWGEDALQLDRFVHTMSIPQRAEQWYAALEPGERAVIDAFVAGANSFATEHPDQIAPEMRAVLPLTGTDVLAHVQRVVLFSFVSSPMQAMGAVKRWSEIGSNGWAIAPSRSASGHALLLANPHLPWGGFFTLYEAQLVAPGLDVYGVTFVGFPFIAIGFNNDLAWTHTVNTFDGADLFELKLADGGYSLDGATKQFTERKDTLRVRQADGQLRDEPLVVHESEFGPVIGMKSGKALALRVVGLDAPHLLGQYMQMARAKNVDEFQRALSRLQLPMFNVVYADRGGHIMEVFNARVPRRSEGDVKFWAGIVPGDRGALMWKDVLPFGDLPKVVDPASGWLQNANEPPWWMTSPGAPDPAKFPPYLAPLAMDQFRSQRSLELIQAEPHMTLDKLVADKFSTRLGLADRVLSDLIAAAERGGPLAKQAAAVLAKWDHTTDAASRGSVLFTVWAKKYLGRDTFASPGFATPWSAQSALTTPKGLSDPQRAATTLEEAAKEVTASYGALDVSWGDVHRVRYAGVDVPASGSSSDFGSFDAAWYDQADGGKQVVDGGNTYIAAVELGPTVQAKTALVYGNSSRDGSPHRADQLPLLEHKQLRDAWRTRPDVEAHVERREPY